MTRTMNIAISLLCTAASLATCQDHPRVLIVYYSATGHTRAMAEAVAQGAQSVDGTQVLLRSGDQATTDNVLQSDAIIVGSPVQNAAVAPEVQSFINRWPFDGKPLADKVGAAFCTAGGISAGEELVQLSILHSMLIFGMIVVGGPEWSQAFGASAVTAEFPFTTADSSGVDQEFLRKGFALGKRVAELTGRIHHKR
jgi:NAD(P)H dehydrogenase (quinone)